MLVQRREEVSDETAAEFAAQEQILNPTPDEDHSGCLQFPKNEEGKPQAFTMQTTTLAGGHRCELIMTPSGPVLVICCGEAAVMPKENPHKPAAPDPRQNVLPFPGNPDAAANPSIRELQIHTPDPED
jgi:hypothetical protein